MIRFFFALDHRYLLLECTLYVFIKFLLLFSVFYKPFFRTAVKKFLSLKKVIKSSKKNKLIRAQGFEGNIFRVQLLKWNFVNSWGCMCSLLWRLLSYLILLKFFNVVFFTLPIIISSVLAHENNFLWPIMQILILSLVLSQLTIYIEFDLH